jgi:hypothetical protein
LQGIGIGERACLVHQDRGAGSRARFAVWRASFEMRKVGAPETSVASVIREA